MKPHKKGARQPAPVPTGHDKRGKERSHDPVPHSKPMAQDGISGYWE